jgi:hypothetical protein
MVHEDPSKTKKKNEEDDVQVVILEGMETRENFDHGEGSGQNPDGNIRKAPQTPPIFYDSQQKKLLCDA